MIDIGNNRLYSNLLVFKFENFNLPYPKDIENLLKFSTHTGKFRELDLITTMGKSNYKRIFIIGLGLTEEFNSYVLFKAIGTALSKLRDTVEDLDILNNFSEDFGYTFGESIALSLYKFKGLKNNFLPIKLNKINIISSYKSSIEKGLISGESINFAREIANLPSNIVTPKYLVQKAESMAVKNCLDVTIYDKYMLQKLGMNLITHVGKGSFNEPYLIIMQYFGDPDSKDITALIGKGITFDSGGVSIKPSKGMHYMINDMSGAASVLGTMKAISKIKPKKNVIALVPVAENMPSSKAYKPGDVIKSYSGKTIQVISTDAEGRLVLADAISYAKELGATTIIDVATLTGSCANFLGGINIGLLCNSNKLSKELIKSGKETGEYLWRLPNNEEYMEKLKTPSADLKNTGDNSGAIVAGLFLQSFAGDINFAHLDIAGCSSSKIHSHVYEEGANGVPTRTLINFILKEID